jgi:deoxycytidine triphosphate deaminase
MAVLGDRDITAHLDEIFRVGTADPKQVRAAKYYLTLGERFLILPNGRRYSDEGPRRSRSFVLKPGQTALVSTKEELAMPMRLSGIVGQRFDLTDNGILFFGGMLVDPGFGWRREDNGDWIPDHEPLSFHLANLGSEPFQIHPGKDTIASIAFFEVSNPRKKKNFKKVFETPQARRVRKDLFDSADHDPPDQALGLVEDLSQLRSRVEKFEASTQQVVLFGVIVLAVTLFAAIVSLVVSDPKTEQASSLALDDVVLGVSVAVALLAVLVVGFYLSVSAVVALRRDPKGEGWLRQRLRQLSEWVKGTG